MPYLNEKEIDNLVSRAVSKALGSHKTEQRAANARAVDEIVDEQSGDEKLITAGGSSTGFASACAESHAKLASRAEQKLIALVRKYGAGASAQ